MSESFHFKSIWTYLYPDLKRDLYGIQDPFSSLFELICILISSGIYMGFSTRFQVYLDLSVSRSQAGSISTRSQVYLDLSVSQSQVGSISTHFQFEAI